jgi:hypothetical protein
LLGLFAGAAGAADDCLGEAAVATLLDPDAAVADRVALVATATECARGGDAWSAYVLGSAYRQPGARWSGVLSPDPGRALPLLMQAARGGERLAFAKLAETYLAIGDHAEAMAWAQAHAHLERTDDGLASGYSANLVQRILAALGREMDAAMDARAQAIIAREGAAYLMARAPAMQGAREPGLVPVEERRAREVERNPRVRMPDSGFVEYFLDVDGDGRVVTVHVLDATPASNLSRDLRSIAYSMRFNGDRATPHRYAVLPVFFDDRRLQLR